jgi:hypothetical protein
MKPRCEAVTRSGIRCSIGASKVIKHNNLDKSVRVCGSHLLVFKEYLEEFSAEEAIDRLLLGITREWIIKK